jgi:prepilin-type N-terminal cleavage/methylation domain-containing protein/prepilin-type processing-associated H-X9-DG protein
MKQNEFGHRRGFTLVELLVVIAMIAILVSLLVPAMGRATYGPGVAACRSNYRQWGVLCSVYANDSPQLAYPTFPISNGSGKNVWDVAPTMISGLQPYGLTVKMWFCPVRPYNFDAANQQCITVTGHDLRTLTDLQAGTAYLPGGATFDIIYHDVWIPRTTGYPYLPTSLFPTRWNYILGVPNINANEAYQWPSRLTESAVSKVPILSDRVVGTSTNLLQATEGHPWAGRIESVNVLFGDGHVDQHQRSVMQWRWKGTYYTFY